MTAYTFPFAHTQDQRIHDDVRRQLIWQPDIQSDRIKIAVRNGTVFLTGRVLTCLEKREAEKAAKAPFGVLRVVNQLVVDPLCLRSDPEIANDVRAALINASSILDDLPYVSVHNGIVTLSGDVHWHFESQRAENTALAVLGVKCVNNLIHTGKARTAKSPPSPHSLLQYRLAVDLQQLALPAAVSV